jgi:hypothetical protein
LTQWLSSEAVVAGIEAEFGGPARSAKNVAAFQYGRLLGLQLSEKITGSTEVAHG